MEQLGNIRNLITNQETTWNFGHRIRCYSVTDTAFSPVFIECNDTFNSFEELRKWMIDYKDTIERVIIDRGAIVMRGFPISSMDDFGKLMQVFTPYSGGYQGGAAARRQLADNVYEATQLSEVYKISLHQEMYYMKTYPGKLAFCSLTTPSSGGETIIGNMRVFTAAIPKSLRTRMMESRIKNIRSFAPARGVTIERDKLDERGWDFAFYTDSKSEVERICKIRGLRWEWQNDGGLTVVNELDAFACHPMTKEPVFRAGIQGMYQFAQSRGIDYRPSESELTTVTPSGIFLVPDDFKEKEVEYLYDTCSNVEVSWEWEKGDLMVIDNLETAHGRNRFVGERETLVAMLE